jgi:UDP-3-O-[3-hydroxymyristoyl] glucosamine N-acyltransferase
MSGEMAAQLTPQAVWGTVKLRRGRVARARYSGQSFCMLINAIARELDATLDGDGAIEIHRLVHPDKASRSSDLALAMGGDAVAALTRTKARAVVVSGAKPVPDRGFAAILTVKEPRIALARLTALFDPGPAHGKGIHPSAIVAPDAEIGPDVSIGPFVVVGSRSRIGAGCAILSHVSIGAEVTIGANALIHPGARIGDRVRVGDRAILHPNVCIGIDGFSFAPDMASPIAFKPGLVLTRIHSLGTVEIGDDVEIGAATTIDRATIEATRIGSGTKIDNHVHIGHNVTIGEACIVCGKVGISGSVKIGDRVRLAGGVGIADHVTIGDEAVVAAGSGVGTNVAAGSFVSGYPAQLHNKTAEQFLYLGRQKRLHGKVDEMSTRLSALEQAIQK